MSVKMEIWGETACFTRPEMKAERVSYDIPTPSAARGMLESVYYHPGLKWHIDRIWVLKPIQFTNGFVGVVLEEEQIADSTGCALAADASYLNGHYLTSFRSAGCCRALARPAGADLIYFLTRSALKSSECRSPSSTPLKTTVRVNRFSSDQFFSGAKSTRHSELSQP